MLEFHLKIDVDSTWVKPDKKDLFVASGTRSRKTALCDDDSKIADYAPAAEISPSNEIESPPEAGGVWGGSIGLCVLWDKTPQRPGMFEGGVLSTQIGPWGMDPVTQASHHPLCLLTLFSHQNLHTFYCTKFDADCLVHNCLVQSLISFCLFFFTAFDGKIYCIPCDLLKPFRLTCVHSEGHMACHRLIGRISWPCHDNQYFNKGEHRFFEDHFSSTELLDSCNIYWKSFSARAMTGGLYV